MSALTSCRQVATPAGSSADVWCFPLDLEGPDDIALLSRSEIDRANRFAFALDRSRYIASHAMLRRLLGRTVGKAPAHLKLGFDTLGKPLLIEAELSFNLSHSIGHAAVAISLCNSVGVDVESQREVAEVQSTALSIFTYRELARWRAKGMTLQDFFCGWTRKEAALKAVGLGLRIDPKVVDVHGKSKSTVPMPVAIPGIKVPVMVCSLVGAPGAALALAWTPKPST